MEQLKKRSTALLIVLVLIVGVSGFKSRITFAAYAKAAETAFYEGINGASIADDLNSKLAASKNLIVIAKKYLKLEADEIKALNQAISALEEADAISEKAQANQQLDTAFFALSDGLSELALSERDEQYRISLTYDYRGYNDMIDKNSYHELIEEYISAASAFPASMLYQISGIELSRFKGGSQ